VPAAAVIPAPIMYANIAAVEKSVVSTNTVQLLCKDFSKIKLIYDIVVNLSEIDL